MERIKQALERARHERQDTSADLPKVSPSALEGVKDSYNTPSKIVYTQTQSFVPKPKTLARNRVLLQDGADTATTAVKVLRTQVLQRMKMNNWNTLAITSPGGGEGKTLTAINLAISLAKEISHSVLLIDLDLRRPSVHRYFGYEPEKGLSDLFHNDAAVHELLVNPGVPGLVLIPGRESLPNSSELLSSPRMLHFVNEVKGRYPNRFVIFDLPPVLSADDALAFAPYVDAALLVVQEGKTAEDQVLQSMKYLAATNVLGTVLNGATDGAASYV